MLVREKETGEEWSCPLDGLVMELCPPFSQPPGDGWEYEDLGDAGVRYRNTLTGELRYPAPNAVWCLRIPEVEETDLVPVRDWTKRLKGDWDYVHPGYDPRYELVPENDQERAILERYRFTIPE
jgi:hypothetical protein